MSSYDLPFDLVDNKSGKPREGRKYDFAIGFQAVVEQVLWPRDDAVSESGWGKMALEVDLTDRALDESKTPITDEVSGQTLYLGDVLHVNHFGNITAVGTLAHLTAGMSVYVLGYIENDRKYGEQFNVVECYPIEPENVQGVEAVVGSGLLPGVRERMASRIVEEYDMRTYAILDGRLDIVSGKTYPFGDDGAEARAVAALIIISGITDKKARIIHAAWLEHRAVADLIAHLSKYRISPKLALRIYGDLGASAVRQIEENPYVITKVRGIGFTTADKMARRMGIEPDSPLRVDAGLREALRLAENEGHVFLWNDQLVNVTSRLFEEVDGVENNVVGMDFIEAQLTEAIASGDIVTDKSQDDLGNSGAVLSWGDDDRVACYQPWAYKSERVAAEEIDRLMRRTSATLMRLQNLQDSFWTAFWQVAETRNGFSYSDEQREAVQTLLTNKVAILTGGPGVGKTTVVKDVLMMAKENGLKVALAAPSGKAAKRAQEATGFDASTIHRLLEAQGSFNFGRNANNKLDADLIVIDEVSMVDVYLLAALVSACKDEAHLILVGDPNQLPSVGPGLVLRHLLDSPIPVAPLTKVYRQKGTDNLIIVNCNKVLAGDSDLASRDFRNPTLNDDGQPVHDFYRFLVNDPEQAQQVATRLVTETIPQTFGYDQRDIQVLSPQKSKAAGVRALNVELQARLNPPSRSKEQIIMPDKRIFRVGDRVMMTKNDYEKNIFNGDTGEIVRHDKVNEIWYVRMDDDGSEVEFTRSEMYRDLLHCWAMTVHKSQGSEYPVLVLLALDSHFIMLYRALLYTGLSRGKKTVILITTKRALGRATSNNPEAKRNSLLVQRVEARLNR